MNPLFRIPERLADLNARALQAFIDETVARIQEVVDAPTDFAVDGRTIKDIRSETELAVAAVQEARSLLAIEGEETLTDDAAGDEVEGDEPVEETPDGENAVAVDEDDAAAFASFAEAIEEPAVEEIVEEPAAVVAAAAPPAVRRRTRPARSIAAAPPEVSEQMVALTAAAGASDLPLGTEFPDAMEIARAMIRKTRDFTGLVPEGTFDRFTIAQASWGHMYGDDRSLVGKDEAVQENLVRAVTDPRLIEANFAARRKAADGGSLVASGGLCAPVTPYYNLMMIATADRPVRDALPPFNADRGGLKYAQPASLSSITTGVGALTVAQDAAGGTTGTKSCQVIDCPPFVETDVEILFHCLQFGNLGARTFPERVAQWNNLVLAAHARLGERTLLTGIDTASTAVTAASLGLGASADLLSEILVAASGMRSRQRMSPDAVLRVLLPAWVKNLVVSDVYRSQFGRWDMTPDKFVALLRQGNVEPSFYIDSASGKSQEFGAQSAGALLPFPSTTTWYLFPEGSFLYLDGGVLELGLVRDSVLNSTNSFQIFGESFENVAFIGVESLAVTSTICDNGVTAGTHNVTCPIDYTHTS